MTMIRVISRDGQAHELSGKTGRTVMELIRDSDLDELQAICGGSCACATCHVFVEKGLDRLLPLSEDENELLTVSAHRQENSRLSCQLSISEELDGLVVRIAPED